VSEEELEIEKALIAGLNSGDPIRVDDAFWERMKAETLRRHASRKP